MPNPLYLRVMGVELHEYNTYSPDKKDRFQRLAQRKLATLHETDMKAYTELTVEPPIDEAVSPWETKAEEENL